MDPVYNNALRPRRDFRCLKQWLEPLTLAHWFLLHEINSRLLDPTKEAQFRDLRLAVFICSRPAARARWALSGGFLSMLWVCSYFWAWGLLLSFSKFTLRDEAEAFFAYLQHYLDYPSVRTKPSKEARTLGAPEPWRLLVMLMKDFRCTKAEAMRVTVLEAHVLWAVDCDRDGRIELVPQDPAAISTREQLINYARSQRAENAQPERN